MDFEHNGQDVTKFMHKVKKQAKRLFQLSKTNSSNLQINSLSKAQEILAQINGYPDWHALEKQISSKKSILVKNTQSARLELERYSYENLYFLENPDTITTFLRVNALPTDIEKIQQSFIEFNNNFSFQINMKLHDIALIIEQKNKVFTQQSSYSLYDISKSFNLTQEQAKSLFYIDNSQVKPINENELTFYFIITSATKNKNEHINLCLSMLSTNQYKDVYFESMPYIDKDQLDSFQLENGKVSKELEDSLLVSPDGHLEILTKSLLIKWVYLLNYLIDKKIGFLVKYSLINKTITYEFENYEKDKQLIDSFIYSAIKTVNYNKQELKYITKANFNYINNVETKGLSVKSQLNNAIFNYDDNSNMRTNHVNVIYGKPGSGKSMVNNMITLSSILEKNLNEIPNIAIIDVGSSYTGLMQLIKNILPVEVKYWVKNFNIQNTDQYIINPFDLALGQRKYDYDDCCRISSILMSFFDDTEGLRNLLNHAIEGLSNLPDKIYSKGIEIHIDRELEKLNYQHNEKTTWWNIVDYLFREKQDSLALKAQRYATPVLSDLMICFQHEKTKDIYQSLKTNTGETIIDYATRIIIDLIDKYPFIDKTTQLELGDTKIAYFNLEHVCNFKDFTIQNYWFALVLNLSSYHLNGLKNSMCQNCPTQWEGSWKDYINNENIMKIYQYYNKNKFMNNWQLSNKIIIDEFHRFSNYKSNFDKVVDIVRLSRKYNVSITISSQSLTNFEPILDFATAVFISETTQNENDLLKQYGFEHNELEIMKKIKFPNWGLKLKTNRGKIFDILKFEMTPALHFALSNVSEDVLMRNELVDKYDYFIALEKATKYLKEANIKNHTFKSLFQQKRDSNIKQEDIVKNIIQSIK